MTILLSYNEVQSTSRKAASGAGLPYGVAEAIGHAAAWLSGRGVDAVSVVVAALADGPAILDGLAAIDTLAAGETAHVALKDDSAGLLLLGLAGAAMQQEVAFALDRGRGGIVLLAGLALRILAGRMRLPERAIVVEGIGLYWHFVDIVWIFLFPVLYLAR